MNIKNYMKGRLMFPLIFFAAGIFSKEKEFFFCLAIGYMMCWFFSYIAICKEFANHAKSETEDKNA